MSTRRYSKGGWGPPRKDEAGNVVCRWCGKPPPKGRRTFCGEACVHEWRLRTDGQYLRRQVFARDRGICALCKRDTDPTRRRMAELAEILETTESTQAREAARAEYHQIRVFGPRATVRWEADHIVPVVEGGGECGLENIRTLCAPCHHQVTAELAARLARKRKQARTGQRSLFEEVA